MFTCIKIAIAQTKMLVFEYSQKCKSVYWIPLEEFVVSLSVVLFSVNVCQITCVVPG